MEKKLEDYLHLYLGCEVVTPDGVRKLIGLNGLGNAVVRTLPPETAPSSAYFIYHESKVKLLLRPLSDMTEEEAWESWKFLANAHNKGVTNPKYILLGNVGMDISPYQSANIVKWMLSKDFDLFGLIEAGLAIDKTKL